mgnify:CR=1 FL=1
MITIKSDREIELMKQAGAIVWDTHQYLKQFIKAGITTKELDEKANDFIIKSGATPSFKNLYGFPGTICISINDEVVHGIPGKRKLKNGDINRMKYANWNVPERGAEIPRALLAAGWLAHLGSRYALGLWLRHIVGSTWVPSLSWPIVLYNTLDSFNDFAAVALLVLTVALWRGWRQSRSKTK